MAAIVLLVLLSSGGGGWYAYTGYLRPARTCKKCKGLGFKRFVGNTYTQCRKCGGYGKILRPAARHVARKRARAGKPVRVVNAR
jgi:DnaJ-class molecular chaperone